MMRLPSTQALCLGFLALVATGCGSTTADTGEFTKTSGLMEQTIQERIALIEYQNGSDLIGTLNWLTVQGNAAMPYLIEGLDHRIPKIRANCAWVMGRIGNRKAVPYLRQHADDQNATVRLEVARQLVMLGDFSRVDTLIQGLDSEDQRVRYLAHDALRTATGKDFGYDHRVEDPQARSETIGRWRDWWSQQQGSDWFQNSQPASPNR